MLIGLVTMIMRMIKIIQKIKRVKFLIKQQKQPIIQNSYSNILFVSDLPNGTTQQDLEILFNDYQYIRAFLNNSKINKIWAQVILENEIWANKAHHELNGIFLIPLSANNDTSKGRPIRICKYELKYYKKKDIEYNKNLLVKIN